MPDVETAGTLAVPIWLAVAGASVLAVSLLLAIMRAGGVVLISSLFRVGLIAVGILSLWLYLEQREKYTAIWDRPADGAATAPSPPVALPSAPGGGQEHDPPSSKSTPPVSMMAPEGPPLREATESESADVMPQPFPPRPAPQAPQATPPPAGAEPPVQSAVVTPVPPRRPPQVRAPPPRAAAAPQLPPLDARGTPPPPPGPFR
jgi:hypothetical protein